MNLTLNQTPPKGTDNADRRIVAVGGANGYLAGRLSRALLEGGREVLLLVKSQLDIQRLPLELRPFALETAQVINEPEKLLQNCLAVINTITSYGRSGESLSEMLTINVETPLRLLEAASLGQVPLFLSIGTVLSKEDNAYSLTKHQFVELAELLSVGRKIKFCNIICDMFFGPHETDLKKFPNFIIHELVRNADQIILSSGEYIRDFIHVDDLAKAIITITLNETGGAAHRREYVVGSGEPVSIRHFAELAKKLAESRTELVFGGLPSRPPVPGRVESDYDAIRSLGWSPSFTLEASILQVIAAKKFVSYCNI